MRPTENNSYFTESEVQVLRWTPQRWKRLCINRSKMPESATETEWVDKSWRSWSTWLKTSMKNSHRWKHQISAEWWENDNVHPMNALNKQKCQLSNMSSTSFPTVWRATDAHLGIILTKTEIFKKTCGHVECKIQSAHHARSEFSLIVDVLLM